MRNRVKLSVSISSELSDFISEIARKRKISRSRLVEEAFAAWRRKQLEALMAEGYRAMAEENLNDAAGLLTSTRDLEEE